MSKQITVTQALLEVVVAHSKPNGVAHNAAARAWHEIEQKKENPNGMSPISVEHHRKEEVVDALHMVLSLLERAQLDADLEFVEEIIESMWHLEEELS